MTCKTPPTDPVVTPELVRRYGLTGEEFQRIELNHRGGRESRRLDLTLAGATVGTLSYMSPEQARGESLDSRSDLFSLGIVLYELAVGQHPFPADSHLGVLNAILAQPPLPPTRLNPEIPAALEGLLLRMLEAVRILSALHVKPRRTIRIALWSGEEEGLLGSLAYVQQHFGSFENQKPEYTKLDAYFNIDSGTGKPRGAGVFGPAGAADMVREALMPFADWGFMGAVASDSRRTGGTDSTSFNNAGLPGIGLAQDAFDYGSFTHHTNLDTYERIYEQDVREGAVEIASAVYSLAMADQMVPRFKPEEMPKPVPEPGPGSQAAPVRHVPAK